MKVAIEPFIYYHTQTPGYQVRRRVEGVEKSKYFSAEKHGGLRNARRKARNWKTYKLLPYFRAIGIQS